jgi:hypothetical protein
MVEYLGFEAPFWVELPQAWFQTDVPSENVVCSGGCPVQNGYR